MSPLRDLIATLREDLREFRGETRDDLAKLRAEVANLKESRASNKAWVAGALAVAGLALHAATWLLRVAPLVLLLSCGEVPLGHLGYWIGDARVLLSDTLSADCVQAADEAALWWRQYSPHLTLPTIEADHAPRMGEIVIREQPLDASGRAGVTHTRHLRTGELVCAVVTLDTGSCGDADVARHELGHALGLLDMREGSPSNVMWWATWPGKAEATQLTEEQIQWVAR